MNGLAKAREGLRKRLEAKAVKLLSAEMGRDSQGNGIWVICVELPNRAVTTVHAPIGSEKFYSDRTLDDVAHRIQRYVTKPSDDGTS